MMVRVHGRTDRYAGLMVDLECSEDGSALGRVDNSRRGRRRVVQDWAVVVAVKSVHAHMLACVRISARYMSGLFSGVLHTYVPSHDGRDRCEGCRVYACTHQYIIAYDRQGTSSTISRRWSILAAAVAPSMTEGRVPSLDRDDLISG